MREIVRRTASVCPVCLQKLPAVLEREPGRPGIWLTRTCPAHGAFSAPVWRDRVDFALWTAREEPLSAAEGELCGGDCRACARHGQDTCCVLLEVTARCDLRCRFCFADGGRDVPDPTKEELFRQIDDIAAQAGEPLLQFSGGEPTLRDDLPELVRHAKEAGCAFAQVNTNGLRLARDEDYVRDLAEAGLDIVFLQFDGPAEATRQLRGADLLEAKRRAIEICGRHRIGVTLVPTVVRGVNDRSLGEIVRLAVALSPAVRGVHFQPVTYLGRHPSDPAAERYTLDELIADLCAQTGLSPETLIPSRCDHALCGFHGSFLVTEGRELLPLTNRAAADRPGRTGAGENRRFVGSRWRRGPGETEDAAPADETAPLRVAGGLEGMDFDAFVARMRGHSLTLSAMAFQDAMNLNLERLYRCSLHVYEQGRLLPFCGRYLTPVPEAEI